MKNTWNDFVKPIVVLGVICLVTSLLLAATNNVTAPIIAENAVKTANATRQAVRCRRQTPLRRWRRKPLPRA